MMRHRRLAAILAACGLAAGCACAQMTNEIELVASAQPRDVTVYHKASSKAVWLVTLKDQNGAVNLTGHTPVTLGVKVNPTDAAFQVYSTGVVQSASAGTVLFTMTGAEWITNIASTVTWYGDVRYTDYDLPLPSLSVKLKPGYNTGQETYAAPSHWEWRTNGVALSSPRVVDVLTPLTGSVSGDILSLSSSVGTTIAGDNIDVATNGTEYTVSLADAVVIGTSISMGFGPLYMSDSSGWRLQGSPSYLRMGLGTNSTWEFGSDHLYAKDNTDKIALQANASENDGYAHFTRYVDLDTGMKLPTAGNIVELLAGGNTNLTVDSDDVTCGVDLDVNENQLQFGGTIGWTMEEDGLYLRMGRWTNYTWRLSDDGFFGADKTDRAGIYANPSADNQAHFTRSSDTDTGMQLPANNQLALLSKGNTNLLVSASGVTFREGATVTNILTAAGSNDTSIVTSGEIDRRIAVVSDAAGDFMADGSVPMTGDLNMNNNDIVNCATIGDTNRNLVLSNSSASGDYNLVGGAGCSADADSHRNIIWSQGEDLQGVTDSVLMGDGYGWQDHDHVFSFNWQNYGPRAPYTNNAVFLGGTNGVYCEGPLHLAAGASPTNIATTLVSNDTSLATGAGIAEHVAAAIDGAGHYSTTGGVVSGAVDLGGNELRMNGASKGVFADYFGIATAYKWAGAYTWIISSGGIYGNTGDKVMINMAPAAGYAHFTRFNDSDTGLQMGAAGTMHLIADKTTNVTVTASGVTLASGATVNNIATTLVSNDTSIATGAAIAKADKLISSLAASDGSPNPALSVNADGDIGIGTNDAPYKLFVTDSGYPIYAERVTSQTNGNRYGLMMRHTSTGDMADGFASSIGFVIQDTAGVANEVGYIGSERAGADNTADLIFVPKSAGSFNERMRIEAGGNVGINDSTPSYTLDVNGTLRVTGKATFSGGTDPKYLHTERTTEAQILAYIKRDIPPSKLNGLVEFFASVNGQVSKWGWIPSTGKVYNMITGDLEKTVAPLTADDLDYTYETQYRLDPELGTIVAEEVAVGMPHWQLKDGYSLDQATGILTDQDGNPCELEEAAEVK